jgi:hypothetical protein
MKRELEDPEGSGSVKKAKLEESDSPQYSSDSEDSGHMHPQASEESLQEELDASALFAQEEVPGETKSFEESKEEPAPSASPEPREEKDTAENESNKLLSKLSVSEDTSQPILTLIYFPGSSLPNLSKYADSVIEVRIAAKFLTVRNREVFNRQLWGSDLFTDDSDLVASKFDSMSLNSFLVLVHRGKLVLRNSFPSTFLGLAVRLKLVKAPETFESSTQFKLRSRSWHACYDRCALQLLEVHPIKVTITRWRCFLMLSVLRHV